MSKIDTLESHSIVIASHGTTTFRRIGWRLNDLGHSTHHFDFEPEPDQERALPYHSALIVDLGNSQVHIDQSFNMLVNYIRTHERMPCSVLVPRMAGTVRPQWAELGVGLAIDRVCPPPEIVKMIHQWLKLRV